MRSTRDLGRYETSVGAGCSYLSDTLRERRRPEGENDCPSIPQAALSPCPLSGCRIGGAFLVSLYGTSGWVNTA
jgi:hypothetical protein